MNLMFKYLNTFSILLFLFAHSSVANLLHHYQFNYDSKNTTIDPGARWVHDPCIITQGNYYYVFSTAPNIAIRRSTDTKNWENIGTVFSSPPDWATNEVPLFDGNIWAPDISFWNGKYYLYYSISSFGSWRSCIGLAVNTTLDPDDPAYEWIDQGKVIESWNAATGYNAIDGNLAFEISGGTTNLWLDFGSMYSGVMITPLEPATGKPNASPPTVTQLATDGILEEAPFIVSKNGYYHLFLSSGSCCQGANSTYNIMAGRSTNIAGPYVDINGVDLKAGGGNVLLSSHARWRGPGHCAVLLRESGDLLVHHAYDAENNGMFVLQVEPLLWNSNGWPFVNSNSNAIDSVTVSQTGSLENCALFYQDTSVELHGDGGYVDLPDGIISTLTNASFEAWLTWDGKASGNWQRIFSFGNSAGGVGTGQIFLTPDRYDGKMELNFAAGDIGSVVRTTSLQSHTQQHVVSVVDVDSGLLKLYLNGHPVASAALGNNRLANLDDKNNWLGKSQWAADSTLDARMLNEFRIYGHPLTDNQIFWNRMFGPDKFEQLTPTANIVCDLMKRASILYQFADSSDAGTSSHTELTPEYNFYFKQTNHADDIIALNSDGNSGVDAGVPGWAYSSCPCEELDTLALGSMTVFSRIRFQSFNGVDDIIRFGDYYNSYHDTFALEISNSCARFAVTGNGKPSESTVNHSSPLHNLRWYDITGVFNSENGSNGTHTLYVYDAETGREIGHPAFLSGLDFTSLETGYAEKNLLVLEAPGNINGGNIGALIELSAMWPEALNENEVALLSTPAVNGSMEILGNNHTITNGDVNPSPVNFTDFGDVKVGSHLEHTFSIHNNGSVDLYLTGDPLVDISNSYSNTFTITYLPQSIISSSSFTSFKLTFSPEVFTTLTASVNVKNSDPANNPYTFEIRGEGVPEPYCLIPAVFFFGRLLLLGNKYKK